MKFTTKKFVPAFASALVAVTVIAGAATPSFGASKTLTNVTLVSLPVTDTATAVIAQEKGFFAQEGLNVKLQLMQTGPATTAAIVSGAAQFSQSNYATLFSARSKGVPVEIVSEAARARPGFSAVVTSPGSSIKSPRDLVGKRVATSVIGGIGPLAIDAWLMSQGINYQTIKWVQMPFPDMGAALQRNQVDAAWVVEPFVSVLKKTMNTHVVFDVFSKITAGLPVSAYATNVSYAKAHPEIVAAFQRAIAKAAALADKNPALVRQTLPRYTAIKAALAGKIALEYYPTKTDVKQIQRDATFMNNVGFLTSPFDASTMVWSQSH